MPADVVMRVDLVVIILEDDDALRLDLTQEVAAGAIEYAHAPSVDPSLEEDLPGLSLIDIFTRVVSASEGLRSLGCASRHGVSLSVWFRAAIC